jgi:hypothetical protein
MLKINRPHRVVVAMQDVELSFEQDLIDREVRDALAESKARVYSYLGAVHFIVLDGSARKPSE